MQKVCTTYTAAVHLYYQFTQTDIAMGYRINERNAGHWTLDGEPKKRRTKKQPITEREKQLAIIALKQVYECLEYDPDLSDVGQNNPAARFTDGGRFLLNFSRESFEALGSFIEKFENA